jgi:class 3 adenylate cyclase
MITPSLELVAVVTRWTTAMRERDRQTMENLLSAAEELRYIGTATGEIWGGKLLRQGIGDHFDEVPEFSYGPNQIEAFESGTTGWALWQGTIHLPGGVVSDYRISFVFLLEHGAWKIVQIHLSNPTSNYEKIGVEHRALDALIAAAQEGFDGLGREGIATIMFTDVVDSSALADLIGDRDWMRRIDAHLSGVSKIIENAGGTLVKSLGDGTMSSFTSGSAALKAAQTIQRTALAETESPALRLRIGLHTGEVIENKGDFFGTVVNKAARINTLAAPDEIRLSDATRIMIGRTGDFETEDVRESPLKGLDGLHRTYRLLY